MVSVLAARAPRFDHNWKSEAALGQCAQDRNHSSPLRMERKEEGKGCACSMWALEPAWVLIYEEKTLKKEGDR